MLTLLFILYSKSTSVMVAFEGILETSKSEKETIQPLLVTLVPGNLRYPPLLPDSFHAEGAPQFVPAPEGPYIYQSSPPPSLARKVTVVPTGLSIVICSELSGEKL